MNAQLLKNDDGVLCFRSESATTYSTVPYCVALSLNWCRKTFSSEQGHTYVYTFIKKKLLFRNRFNPEWRNSCSSAHPETSTQPNPPIQVAFDS